MARFAAPDLVGLTPPGVVEALDYEEILQDLKSDCVARLQSDGIEYDVEMLESDPVVKILEVVAYRELLLRARVNSAARSVMLSFAQGSDLEQLGVYYGVTRMLVSPATQDSPAVYEDDERLRTRIQLAPEAFSAAGPRGAYIFHTMTVNPTIKSVAVYQDMPGSVQVLPLVSTGDGIPSSAVLSAVRLRLNSDEIRPLTDMVTVRAPNKLEYSIDITLNIKPGPDHIAIKNSAIEAIRKYLDTRCLVGSPVHVSALTAAAHVSGVESVTVHEPAADVVPQLDEYAYNTSLVVKVE